MQNEVTTKRSPMVLIWKFAAVEAVGFFLYFIATLFGSAKYEIYTQLSLSNFISYQVAKILLLSAAQFVLTIYAFLSWYYEEYAVHSGSISHTKGVFRRTKESFPIDRSTDVTVLSGPFGKLFHYGSVHLRNAASSFTLATVPKPERMERAIRGEFEPRVPAFGKEPDIFRLLTEAEHDQLEFKSSLRFDYKAGNASRELEKAVMKTIAAFLNSKGGYLVVGVSDGRKPLGLARDYQTLQRKDSDGFENHFTQAFNNMIGPEFRNLVKLWFHKVDGCDICVIQALASPRPVYLKVDNNEHFYMRTGNISTSLKLSEIESYSRSHWPAVLS
jgi:membrane protein YdbS with pleckstrin-like domain